MTARRSDFMRPVALLLVLSGSILTSSCGGGQSSSNGGQTGGTQGGQGGGQTSQTYTDFSALPDQISTNLKIFFGSGSAKSGDTVTVNGTSATLDSAGNFVVQVPLTAGANRIKLRRYPFGVLLECQERRDRKH